LAHLRNLTVSAMFLHTMQQKTQQESIISLFNSSPKLAVQDSRFFAPWQAPVAKNSYECKNRHKNVQIESF